MNASSLLSAVLPEINTVPPSAPILLVEKPGDLRDSRRLLLSCIHSAVEVADGPSRIFTAGPGPNYRLIVIDLRDPKSAERVAFYSRRRWPRAKILLLGKIRGEFQDALYDEIVDPCCNPVGFVEISRRLLMNVGSDSQ